MKRRPSVALLAALAAIALLGCATSPVSRGAEFYRQGRHIDADLVFEHGEPTLSQLELGERARYALYRGSNYLALGDRDTASRWLAYGAGLDHTAGALSSEERTLLQSGLRATSGVAPARGAASISVASKLGTGLAVRGRLSP
ncbi:MAG: hypothetical protein RL033_7026 [Pseudomonadota bacterium]|jgi:hypothetical protein